jgi:hypothetical protein
MCDIRIYVLVLQLINHCYVPFSIMLWGTLCTVPTQWYHCTLNDTGTHYAALKIASSNSAEGLDVCLLCFLCVEEVAASVTSCSLIHKGIAGV